jgi:protein disulfide-isomerase A6
MIAASWLQGDSYLTKEKSRLDKMLSGGSLAAGKVDEMARKSSVLGHIIGKDEL